MELYTAISKRRSIRKFKSTPLPDGAVEAMLEAARLAPSGGNGQTHIFGIVCDETLRRGLAHAAGNQLWIADAPVVIACCARLGTDVSELPENDFGVEVNRLRWGNTLWNYITACPERHGASVLLANSAPLIPMEHIALTAASLGLSTCFIGWLDTVRAGELLGLPDDIRCLYLLPVGYADEEPRAIERKTVQQISFTDRFDGK